MMMSLAMMSVEISNFCFVCGIGLSWAIPFQNFTMIYTYYLLTGCKGRARIYKSKVFHTARACEGCLENQGLVFPGTARAPSQ